MERQTIERVESRAIGIGAAANLFMAAAAWFTYYRSNSEAILIREPLDIIKTSVIELAGGTLQDPRAAQTFRDAVDQAAAGSFEVADLYMSKTGSLYMLVVYLHAAGPVQADSLVPLRQRIETQLIPAYPHLHLELILRPRAA